MSLDDSVRAVARALRHGLLSDADRDVLADAVFAAPDLLERLQAAARGRWAELDVHGWGALRELFWAESNRRELLRSEEQRNERLAQAAQRQAADEQRRRDHEAQATVVAFPQALPKQNWARHDMLFQQLGKGHHHLTMDGLSTRDLNSLRAYLKRWYPRLAVSSRIGQTYVYRKEQP